MLSIITCSRDPQAARTLALNLRETVGVPFEFIVIDNRRSEFGISAAYNKGAAQAEHPYLCFVHEDVRFETRSWGERWIQHLSDPCTGLIGVAGGDTRGIAPASWSIPIRSNEIHLNQFSGEPGEMSFRHICVSASVPPQVRTRVATLDGVLLGVRRAIFDEFRFDEALLPGFHGYDIDFSLQVGTKYTNYVVFDVLISHFSAGRQDDRWVESARRISRKWKAILPVSVYSGAIRASFNLHHWHALRVYLSRLIELKRPGLEIIGECCRYSFGRYFHVRRFLSLVLFLFRALPGLTLPAPAEK